MRERRMNPLWYFVSFIFFIKIASPVLSMVAVWKKLKPTAFLAFFVFSRGIHGQCLSYSKPW